MHLNLVLKIVSDVHDQEMVALVDQLLVDGVVDRISVDPVLNEEHGQVFDTKTAQKSLVLFILPVAHFLKQNEIALIHLAPYRTCRAYG